MTSSRVVCMFPGQASQFAGMGKDLASEFREFSMTIEEASDALGLDMARLMFQDPDNQLNLTEYTQPAVLTMSYGIARVLRERAGLVPELVAGHSLGEWSALAALGALSFDFAVKAVRFRGQAMQKAVPVGTGAMVAYMGSQGDAVIELCRQHTRPDAVVEVVNFNSAQQLVLSGHKTGVEALVNLIKEQKLGKAIPLPVSAPFHSSLMKPAAEAMRTYFGTTPLQPFAGRIVANVDAAVHTKDDYTTAMLVKQVDSPVLWTQSLETLKREAGEEALWLEVGPGNVLQGLSKKTLPTITTAGTSTQAELVATLSRLG